MKYEYSGQVQSCEFILYVFGCVQTFHTTKHTMILIGGQTLFIYKQSIAQFHRGLVESGVRTQVTGMILMCLKKSAYTCISIGEIML